MPSYTEIQDQNPEEFQKLESVNFIAGEIAALKPYIRQEHGQSEPEINADHKLALSCVDAYRKTFGDDGLSYLGDKFDEIFLKHDIKKLDTAVLKEIEKLIDRVETPLLYKSESAYDKKAFYEGFVASEKKEIASFKLGKNPSLEGRNFNIKEKPMSDSSENLPDEKNLSPRELAFQNAVYQRSMVSAALKNGTLCCLPGKDGYADTTPAVNLANHKVYYGDNLLYLKDHQKRNGFPTAEYMTQAQIEKARDDVGGIYIIKGQKGVSIHFSEKNDETGEWDEKHIRLFNVAQLNGNGPAKFKEWVEDKRLEDFQSQHGTKIQPPEPGQKAKGPEIACSSSNPIEYLGQYFAAVSKGVPFKADQETAKDFAKNMGDSLYAQGINKKTGEPMVSPKTGEPVTDPFKLSRICREASTYCVEFMKELNRQQNPEQKQEQSRKGHSF